MNNFFDRIRENEKLTELIEENKGMLIKVAAAALVVVVAFLFFVFKGGGEEDIKIENAKEPAVKNSEQITGTVFVDIGGEVNEPKLAELPEGSRIEDAIRAAGGPTGDADMTRVNRAAFVNDGEKILIPSAGDYAEADGDGQEPAYYDYGGKININTADSSRLQELSGVGPVTAEKIISYREENGGFSAIEDIKNVSGIGEKTFEKFKSEITV